MMILRSFLFVPGSRIDRVEKAIASSADGVIIDLEDAVTPSQKETVRNQIGPYLISHSLFLGWSHCVFEVNDHAICGGSDRLFDPIYPTPWNKKKRTKDHHGPLI